MQLFLFYPYFCRKDEIVCQLDEALQTARDTKETLRELYIRYYIKFVYQRDHIRSENDYVNNVLWSGC